MYIVGAVLMGGASRRFGSDKALADADGTPLGARVAGALRAAGLDPVVAVGGDAGASLGLITIPDRRPGAGPLAALASILGWAGTGGVVVVPCDHPTLQPADITALVDSFTAEPQKPSIATFGGRPHVSVACWPAVLSRPIQKLVDGGESRFQAALEVSEWRPVPISESSTLDADDPQTLLEVLRFAELANAPDKLNSSE